MKRFLMFRNSWASNGSTFDHFVGDYDTIDEATAVKNDGNDFMDILDIMSGNWIQYDWNAWEPVDPPQTVTITRRAVQPRWTVRET